LPGELRPTLIKPEHAAGMGLKLGRPLTMFFFLGLLVVGLLGSSLDAKRPLQAWDLA
jgi:hypothetical protein